MLIRDVHFFRKDGYRLPYMLIGKEQADQVYVNILFSKMDQKGRGRVLRHVRQHSNHQACIVQELEQWVATLRDQFGLADDRYLFSLPGESDLTSEKLATAMKQCCVRMGIKSELVSCHSLRFGGATMLAASGLPYYIIAYYGGWSENSQTLPLYTQPGREAASKVSAAMAKEAGNGLADTFIRDYVQMHHRLARTNGGSHTSH